MAVRRRGVLPRPSFPIVPSCRCLKVWHFRFAEGSVDCVTMLGRHATPRHAIRRGGRWCVGSFVTPSLVAGQRSRLLDSSAQRRREKRPPAKEKELNRRERVRRARSRQQRCERAQQRYVNARRAQTGIYFAHGAHRERARHLFIQRRCASAAW